MTAQELIEMLSEAGADTPSAIMDVLEDGEALLALGITDQELVEEAYALLLEKAERKIMSNRGWTHKVVKRQRGMDGKWFRSRGTAHESEEAAITAAREFAEEQCAAGVAGTEIDVVARKGRKTIATFKWPYGTVQMVDWRE